MPGSQVKPATEHPRACAAHLPSPGSVPVPSVGSIIVQGITVTLALLAKKIRLTSSGGET